MTPTIPASTIRLSLLRLLTTEVLMRRVLLLAICLLYAAPALAQTGTPTSYVLRVYAQGAATPATTVSVPVANVACNQPVTAGASTNPTKWRWNDPNSAGRDCVFDDSTRLLALADGT